jgi:hypothetical protein
MLEVRDDREARQRLKGVDDPAGIGRVIDEPSGDWVMTSFRTLELAVSATDVTPPG